MIYILIFFAKMIEVSLATIRNVLINRGEKFKGAFIGLFEVTIWLILVSTIVTSISDDPIKAIAYCLAFSAGNYLGVIIENKLAIGSSSVNVVLPIDKADLLAQEMRNNGFGVTEILAYGKETELKMLIIYLRRKQLNEIIDLITKEYDQSIITINDVRNLQNGYLKK